MKQKLLVSFLLDEEDPDLAEDELESRLSDMINMSSDDIVESFEVLEVDELEEEDS